MGKGWGKRQREHKLQVSKLEQQNRVRRGQDRKKKMEYSKQAAAEKRS